MASFRSTRKPWRRRRHRFLAASKVAGGKFKVWTGSAWVEKPAKVWTGSAWVAKPVKFWNGSAWVLS